jgi:hypothetical protein
MSRRFTRMTVAETLVAVAIAALLLMAARAWYHAARRRAALPPKPAIQLLRAESARPGSAARPEPAERPANLSVLIVEVYNGPFMIAG